MIIDCHTHWGSVWEDRDGKNPEPWLNVLDGHQVHGAWIFGLNNLLLQEKASEDNDTLAELTYKAPGRLFPFGTSWIQHGKAAVKEARRCLEDLKLCGLKFHPWMQGFSTADVIMAEICEMAGDLNKPIVFHDGTPCYSQTDQIIALAKRFPNTKFVLGHSGILWQWRTALIAKELPNIWFCLCGPHKRAMELIVQNVPVEKIVWGSDFGFGFSDPISYRLPLIQCLDASSDVIDQILITNPGLIL